MSLSLVSSLEDYEVEISQEVAAFFAQQYASAGEPGHWPLIRQAMKRPPRISTIRANKLQMEISDLKQQVVARLQTWALQQQPSCGDGCRSQITVDVQIHHIFSDVLTIKIDSDEPSLDNFSQPVRTLDATPLFGAWSRRQDDGWPLAHRVVVCDVLCGEAVLRGSHIYAKGIMAADPGIKQGETVAVYAYIGKVKLRRGQAVVMDPAKEQRQPDHSHPDKPVKPQYIFLGLGRSLCKHVDYFRQSKGLAIVMTSQRAGPILPPLSELGGFVQNLPSILVAHCLELDANLTILDMCAAPGGKSCHIASLVRNKATVVACDRKKGKVLAMRDLFLREEATCITPLALDTTQCCIEAVDGQCHTIKELLDQAPRTDDELMDIKELPPSSFDRILLDAPCTALGLRPKLVVMQRTVESLISAADYQKRFFRSAVNLLKPGGILVYSTCTISTFENEHNVRHVLDKYPCMELVPIGIDIGRAGLQGQGLDDHERACVRRFDPADADYDTIGFFVAKFRKRY